MIRKILLPALAIALLGGCVTSGYQYRGGYGDYYYGQPQVEYRDYGYDGYGYGYPGGWRGSYGYGFGYGDPYGYYGGYGGYYDPWNYYFPRRPPVIVVRPRHDGTPDGPIGTDASNGRPPMGTRHEDQSSMGRRGERQRGDRTPVWRDLGRVDQPAPGMRQPRPGFVAPQPPMPRTGDPGRIDRPAPGMRQPRPEFAPQPPAPRARDLGPGTVHERDDSDRDLRRKHQP